MKNRNDRMLVRIAQADAYAAAVEFIKLGREEDQEVYNQALKYEKYCKHPKHNLGAGRYTDDTQMSIGVAEVLLQHNNLPSQLDFANAWVDCFQRDRRDGYARGFQKFLESTKTGEEFLKTIRPHSEKNGAAMRSVPVGVLPSYKEVKRVAEVQAAITHNTVIGKYASVATALLSHWALYEADQVSTMWDAYGYVHGRISAAYLPMWEELEDFTWDGPVHSATETVHAAFQALLDSHSLMEVLDKIIRWQGDTDSVAAIAWGIGSSCPFLKDDAPDWMYNCLEPGRQFGPQFLEDLGSRLMDKYSKGD